MEVQYSQPPGYQMQSQGPPMNQQGVYAPNNFQQGFPPPNFYGGVYNGAPTSQLQGYQPQGSAGNEYKVYQQQVGPSVPGMVLVVEAEDSNERKKKELYEKYGDKGACKQRT